VSVAANLQTAIEFFTRLAQTPQRLTDEAAQRRLQGQQQQLLDVYERIRRQDQETARLNTQAETDAIERRAPIVAAQQAQQRAGEVDNQIRVDNNRAGLVNNTLTTAGGVQAGLIGAQGDAAVRQTEAAFKGAGSLAQTEGGVQRVLQGDRLAAARDLTKGAQDFETGMVDRFIGDVPLAQRNAETVLELQRQQLEAARYFADQAQPTPWDRTLQLLGPTALIAASLAK